MDSDSLEDAITALWQWRRSSGFEEDRHSLGSWYRGTTDEWRVFCPLGMQGSFVYLVRCGVVYEYPPARESMADALRSARELWSRSPRPPINLIHLVHQGLVYQWTPLSESAADAVRSARALRGRSPKNRLW